jgi:hypothetical protein
MAKLLFHIDLGGEISTGISDCRNTLLVLESASPALGESGSFVQGANSLLAGKVRRWTVLFAAFELVNGNDSSNIATVAGENGGLADFGFPHDFCDVCTEFGKRYPFGHKPNCTRFTT